MSADKYLSMCSRQMEAIVNFIISCVKQNAISNRITRSFHSVHEIGEIVQFLYRSWVCSILLHLLQRLF